MFHLEIFLRGGNSNVSRNLEGQWINFLISCKYFKGGGQAYVKGGQVPAPPPLKETLEWIRECTPGYAMDCQEKNSLPQNKYHQVIRGGGGSAVVGRARGMF